MYRVEVVHSKDYSFLVKSAGLEFMTDAKGKDGITPPDLLLGALGSCIGVYIRKYAEGAKLALGNFTINVEAEFSKEPPLSFKVINISIGLVGDSGLDERRQKALVEFIKNCPVHNTLKGAPTVNISLA